VIGKFLFCYEFGFFHLVNYNKNLSEPTPSMMLLK